MENRVLEDSQYKDTDADVVGKYGTRSSYSSRRISIPILIPKVDLTRVSQQRKITFTIIRHCTRYILLSGFKTVMARQE
jgi:hypothetical protein